ncbi:hypothetical protein J3F84DRAFT_373360 [Trichoderma pleuroticola]
MFLRTSKASMVTTIFSSSFLLHLSLLSIFHRSSKGLYAAKKKENFIFPPLTQTILPTLSSHHPSLFVHLTPSMARHFHLKSSFAGGRNEKRKKK